MHIQSLHLLHDTFPTRNFYPFNLEIFQETDCIEFSRPVTFFIGENGTGKSTLLRAIARSCTIHIWEEHEGSRDRRNLYEDLLHQSLRMEWTDGKVPGSFFASEIFRHFAEILDAWSMADPGCLKYFSNDSLVVKSHGQSHMTFFENRFRRKGLYLLDEPENALSPKRQLELLRLLREFIKRGDVQFIIATHSPILLAFPDAEIYSFDDIPIRKIGYEDTDYYRIYRDFLTDRAKYLDEI
jgi:predicted ATPase